MMLYARLALDSRNTKTGPIPVSTTAAQTCPQTCPFYGKGCYALYGQTGMHWRELGRFPVASYRGASPGKPWPAFLSDVAALPPGTLWRHNQAGDLPGDDGVIEPAMLRGLVAANAGKRGFTFTHKPLTPENRALIAEANAAGFRINLSADGLADADIKAAYAIAPIAVALPSRYARAAAKRGHGPREKRQARAWTETLAAYRARLATLDTVTPDGRKVVICPAIYRDDVTCRSCQLCARQRATIVGFPVHGGAVNFADKALAA